MYYENMEERSFQINRGFTIVEVLIFISLISLLFVTVSYIISGTLRDATINRHRILASYYANDAKEWLSSERETDWQIFRSYTSTNGTHYCFDTSVNINWPQSGVCSAYDTKGYKRDVFLTLNPNQTQVTVNIIVSWQDGQNTYKVTDDTIFSLYE